MLAVAPASVLLMGVLGMFVVAFAVMRMVIAETRLRHDTTGPFTQVTSGPSVPRSPAHA